MPSKAVERAVLDVCQKNVPGFQQGQVVERESPDFHVLTGDRTIGIEMQEFIQGASSDGASSREHESLRAKVMRRAQETFESLHPGVHLYIYTYWGGRSPEGKDVPDVAQELAELVWKLMPPPPPEGEYVSHRQPTYDELEEAGLINYLSNLDVGFYPPATYGTWNSSESGYFSQDLTDMQTQVRAKESKLETYRQSCSELWLVLYGLALPSGYFDIDALNGVQMASSFDHVVFIDAVSGRNVVVTGAKQLQ
jgi:hypothetical protein